MKDLWWWYYPHKLVMLQKRDQNLLWIGCSQIWIEQIQIEEEKQKIWSTIVLMLALDHIWTKGEDKHISVD